MSKLAVITGAAGGIGRATVELFVSGGWQVIGLDREQLDDNPRGRDHRQIDVSDGVKVAGFFTDLKGSVQKLDALVNCAAIAHDKSLVETTVEEWDEILAVNLRSAFLMSQHSVDLLRAAAGAIVNVGSVHSIATTSNVTAYAASKGGLMALTRAMALELGSDGIRVNAVIPGAIDTPMLHRGMARGRRSDRQAEEALKQLEARTPLGRVGNPEEIAQAILFLASQEQSSFIAGHGLVVDGGATARLGTE